MSLSFLSCTVGKNTRIVQVLSRPLCHEAEKNTCKSFKDLCFILILTFNPSDFEHVLSITFRGGLSMTLNKILEFASS